MEPLLILHSASREPSVKVHGNITQSSVTEGRCPLTNLVLPVVGSCCVLLAVGDTLHLNHQQQNVHLNQQ